MDASDAVQAAPDLFFRPATSDDLESINHLEAAGYPADEAASRERLQFRLQNASEFFLAAIRPSGDLVGFVCGTLAPADAGDRLTEESMATHDPEGNTLCIHSVCVAENERRRGVATKLLQAYQRWVPSVAPYVDRMLLICKANLVELYNKAGFETIGPSQVVHGQDPWIEMSLKFA